MKKFLFALSLLLVLATVSAIAGSEKSPPGYQVCPESLQVELISFADVPSVLPVNYVYSAPELFADVYVVKLIEGVQAGYDIPETGSAGGIAYRSENNLLICNHSTTFTDYVYIGNPLAETRSEICTIPIYLFTRNLKYPLC
jgi:hypothetical protein